jgi:alpha-ketoglutarate-dependent taurine dioxygenase
LFADSLRVIHEFRPTWATRERYASEQSKALLSKNLDKQNFAVEHPMVAVHPETGERLLHLGSYARHVVGCSTAESAQVLQLFQGRITRPENVVRWQWAAGDVGMWDNRATQHYAAYDYDGVTRVMQRVTISGDVPIGVDGRPSATIYAEQSDFNPIPA